MKFHSAPGLLDLSQGGNNGHGFPFCVTARYSTSCDSNYKVELEFELISRMKS